jgi:hypothetical protein
VIEKDNRVKCESAAKGMENLTRITVPTAFQREAELPLSPHFDDEATLLSARPVVPIGRRVNLGNVRNYLLTAAILLTAALVGAVAALSIDRFQNARHAEPSAIQKNSAPVTEPIVHTSWAPETNETEVISTESPDTVEATAPTTETKKAAPAAQTAAPVKTVIKLSPKNSSVPDKIALKRSQSKETKRENAWNRRNADSGAERPRYAGRIREIFEGPSPN